MSDQDWFRENPNVGLTRVSLKEENRYLWNFYLVTLELLDAQRSFLESPGSRAFKEAFREAESKFTKAEELLEPFRKRRETGKW